MKFPGEIRDWLPWVIKIRFVIISFVFAIDFAIRVFAPNPNNVLSIRHLGMVVILWYIVSLFFLIYNQLSRDYLLQAYLQIFSDLVIITAILHVTGDLESNYVSLYLVAIILASTLLPRGRAFLVAAVSFVFMGAVLELAYLPSLYPEVTDQYPAFRFLATSSTLPVDLKGLQVKIGASLFGFFAVAYLASHLAESLRKAGAELRDKSGQVASLQAINENIIQSMREGLLSTGLDGTISELNPAGAAILGRRREEIRGKPIGSIFSDLQVEGRFTLDPTTSLPRQEITYQHPRGEHRILGVSVSPLVVPESGMAGYVYNFQDLTEEKRREAEYRAKDRMASLGRMAAGIAHEIRNPLASIAGSVKLLQSLADLDEDQAKLISIVSQESERLNKLVSDFLLYYRDQRLEFRPVDLVNLLEETLLLVEHHPQFGPQCRVERRFPRHAVTISADADKLRQVFWNICDNSLKAMPKGGTVTAQIEELGNERLRVTLGDTGIGFTEAQVEELFEPFYSGFSEGTGLGLAIVYQIIQGHQGAIRVESKPGKGARFLIELPRAPVQASADRVLSARSAASSR
jgi:two-component system sensor histidine kinase PilS (NtrC family)